MEGGNSNDNGLTTKRIENLTDGVFSIAMTLLVLDLKDALPRTDEGLTQQLQAVLPKLFSYVISFVILGIFWVAHQVEFYYIERTDRLHLWINILLLMCVALIPFSANLMGERWREQSSIVMYAGNLIVCAVVFHANWMYATARHRLVSDDLDPRIIRAFKTRVRVVVLLYVLIIGVSFWSAALSLGLIVPVHLAFVFKRVAPVETARAPS